MGKTTFKRICSLLLALATVFVLCPAASAEGTTVPATCPGCGEDLDALNYTPWNGTVAYQDNDAHYKLTADITTDFITIASGDHLLLDLNGYTLSSKEGKRSFRIEGTLTVFDSSSAGTGQMVGSDISAKGDNSNGRGGTLYIRGTVNLLGGTVCGGTAARGGNIYSSAGTLNIYGGTVSGGVVSGAERGGGNIYSSSGTLNIYGGTVENGSSQYHGGNIYATGSSVNIYGGTICGGTATGGTTEDGTTFKGAGGNFYVTGYTTTVHMYGGTVTGGQCLTSSGGNLYINSGAQAYICGGVIGEGYAAAYGNNIAVGTYKTVDEVKYYSSLYMLGGTVRAGDEEGCDTDIYSTADKIYLYGGRLETVGFDAASFLADCACMNTDDTGVTIWHYGACTDCLYTQSAELVTPQTGTHAYEAGGEAYSFTCSVCGNTILNEDAVALVNGTLYEDLSAAIAAAPEGGTLMLTKDVAATEVVVSGITLDLNGKVLTVDAFSSAASGHVIDSSGGGKLVSESISLAADNAYLPFTYEDCVQFAKVDFTQWLERIDENTTKIKFYFTQRAEETLLDDAIQTGNQELSVQIRLTWTDSAGNPQDKTFLFDNALLQKYAQKWNGRVFVTTITGVDNTTELTGTWQVQSSAASGTTQAATTLKNVENINQKLTWDAINSYPIKRSDMTVAQMRQLCVDFFNFTKTALWTPDEGFDYIRNAKGSNDAMSQGTIYGGLPYVGSASGSIYRLMDYIDEETGLVDMKKAIPAIGTKDRLAVSDLKYFGNQCAVGCYWGWGRVMNSAYYISTSAIVPNNGYIFLGDVDFDQTISGWSASYNTKMVRQNNGEQVMYEAYALLQKADGMVYYTTAGHVIMAVTDAVVVRKADGTIDGNKSYVYISDQAQSWKTGENDAGDSYQYKSSVSSKKTFKNLFDTNYIPFTYAEFLGTDPIEVTEVSLVGSDDTVYTTGTVDETTRAFTGTATKDTLTWTELFSAKVTSNYGIADVYITLYDNYGNEIYRHAVRGVGAGRMSTTIVDSGARVTTWEYGKLISGRTYEMKLEVQLSTGERPTLYTGKLIVE